VLRLLLLRHAKSAWSGALAPSGDHERPLAPRGRNSASAIGAYLRQNDRVPTAVLCSTARRTVETLSLMLPEWESEPAIFYDRALYLAEWPALLAAIRIAPAHASPLLLLGHNPGLEQLAVALGLQPRTPAERGRAESVARKFPTAALAIYDFDIAQWPDAKPARGRLIDYIRPKDIDPGLDEGK
jgi:phosphohistidine phosphatase